jgi:site-specific DNA recombinase
MTARYNSAREKHYSCLTYNRYGKEHCTQHRTNEKLIYDTVLSEIKGIARLAFKDRNAAIDKFLSQTQKLSKKECDAQNKRYVSAVNRKSELNKMIEKLYQDWTSGALGEDNFKRILGQAQTEQKALDNIIAAHSAATQEAAKNVGAVKRGISILSKYADIAELDASILNELIEKILIDEVIEINGKAQQHMTIHFRFPYIETIQIR